MNKMVQCKASKFVYEVVGDDGNLLHLVNMTTGAEVWTSQRAAFREIGTRNKEKELVTVDVKFEVVDEFEDCIQVKAVLFPSRPDAKPTRFWCERKVVK